MEGVFLSRSELASLEWFSPGSVIDVNSALPNERARGRKYLAELFSRLEGKGELVRVKKGRYFRPSGKAFDDCRMALALAGKRGAYVSFATALNFHHLLDALTRTVYVATFNKSLSKMIAGRKVVLVSMGDRCVGGEEIDGVLVAGRAKAVFDSLLQPEYAGGMTGVARALKEAKFSRSEWRELEYYFRELAPPIAAAQRMGYLLERFRVKDIPPSFIRLLRSLKGNATNFCPLDPGMGMRGKRSEKWMVVDNL